MTTPGLDGTSSGKDPCDRRIRVLVVDDQALVRTGFRMVLEIEPDVAVVGEAVDGAQAVERVMAVKPDVVLMDVRMPVMDGIEAARRIIERGLPTRVVMLTTFDLDEYVLAALQAGASGFVLKDIQPELLVAGIRAVHAGESLLAPSVTRRLIQTYVSGAGHQVSRPQRPPVLDELTPRELEVLVQVARGLSNSEIARALFISETTVKTHVSRLLTKLGLRDRVHAVIYALEHELVE